MKPKPAKAAHMQETDRHGTGDEFLEVARHTFAGEGIHLDPCSEHSFNRHVQARRYLTVEQDATSTPWFPGAPKPLDVRVSAPPSHRPKTVFINPPSSEDGTLVKMLWCATCCYWTRGWISCAVWVGYNTNQRTYLQLTKAPYHPLQLMTLEPNRRMPYRTPGGALANSPPHASYLTLLSFDPFVRRRFAERARAYGFVTDPRY